MTLVIESNDTAHLICIQGKRFLSSISILNFDTYSLRLKIPRIYGLDMRQNRSSSRSLSYVATLSQRFHPIFSAPCRINEGLEGKSGELCDLKAAMKC